MANQDPRLELIRAVHVMVTRITKAVQVTPFVYSSIFLIVYVLYAFLDDKVLDVLDMVFYISPLTALIFLYYSRILHLCKWHRVTCVLPLVPQVAYYADQVFHFTQNEVILFYIVSAMMLLLLIISAFKVFHGRNRC